MSAADVSYASLPSYLDGSRSSHEEYDELPAYSRRTRRHGQREHREQPQRAHHTFELTGTRGRPWATLRLHSSARATAKTPTFFEDEPIIGSVDLDLDNQDPIQAVTVTVKGRLLTGSSSTDALTFLNYTHPIWSKADASFLPALSSSTTRDKLQGAYSWPFSFNLPKKVSVPAPGGSANTYRLPQTFLEKYVTASVQYELTVKITRGKLRADSCIQTKFAYIPCTKPSPPSMLRQLAYQERSPLLAPETDPEGWHVLPGVYLAPTVSASLAVAKPLCYSRGSVIPVFLVMTPSSPSSFRTPLVPPTLQLIRTAKYTCQNQAAGGSEAIESAVWWPAQDHEAGSVARRMYGEISLKKDLAPNMSIAHFSVEYSLKLSASYDGSEALLTLPVEIATQNAHGPRVRAYAPPSYEQDRERSGDPNNGFSLAFNKCSMGLNPTS